MRLIDADELKEVFRNEYKVSFAEVMDEVIDEQPTIELMHWTPVKFRPMDDDERKYWEEHYGNSFEEDYDGIMFDCPMPEDGEEVWVCSKCGNVWQDTCCIDEGIGLEGNGDWDDIVAWMPLNRPEPYKGEENNG